MRIEDSFDKVFDNRKGEVGVQSLLIAKKVRAGDFDVSQNVLGKL